ncbi:penicillin-binding protein activator [uncultured Algimonas sp.]|uniref:penicillin-binding protein activator n=1 Tax=uncultured Algimonas sp. TaxID=1547920 RepID=UPI002614A471|nr:penicillin-binding protein activator [uncultured Algimonas sp.]
MREHVRKTKIELKAALSALAALALCACTTVPLDPPPRQPGPIIDRPMPPVQPQPDAPYPDQTDGPIDGPVIDNPIDVPDDAEPYYNDRQGITLPHMAGRDTKRLALLLPFSARSSRLRDEAASMFQAAELALFQRPDADIVLTVLDTKGTPEGARSAAQAALQQGADVILGPIIADNVTAASSIAARRGVPLLAFSNDQSVADRGRYLVSFPPEAEVDRIVDYAASQGVRDFAYIGPDDAYGRRVRRAYELAVQQVGGQVTATETYSGSDISAMQEPARRLAQAYLARRGSGRSFGAVLMPETGTALRSLAPLLPTYGIDPQAVLFMGTSRWDDRASAREPALQGGVFAAADKQARAAFGSDFESAYGKAPSSLASLAYDAVQLGAIAADGDPRGRLRRLESPVGFFGTDGYLRFGPDGRPERGLAVYRIDEGQFRVADPAPTGPPPET